jgi:hypothetical protein
MKTLKEKREYFMDYMTHVYDILDPSGDNSKMLHDKYDNMSDDEFGKAVERFLNDPRAQFYLEIIEFERDLHLDDIMKCADFQKIPLFEYVAVPHINGSTTENVIVTPEPVAVGYIHGKRMQQTLLKKNTGSISIQRRNAKTGQVTGEDKNARNSNVETYSMIASGADKALAEFMGPRADDMVAKNQMYNKIAKDGYVMLSDLDNDPENKVALNSLDEDFIMQGLITNLVTPLTVLPGK